ncbi:hypothetical protein [Acinetobacter tianfuensis]|uniref:Uncharacterized protein n=1 Tax=Acinetobacter tianfuensis TaxID=2419603 RepID=A0A3A8E842_9GAMM|nr:hypothetical protein [Acinetobacter tianfuensis]RKG29736.1 hypothetical protein D7V32_13790 [Acinetobacter tianfuensis]
MKKQIQIAVMSIQRHVKAKAFRFALCLAVLPCGLSACGGSADSAQLVERYGEQVGRGKSEQADEGRKLTEAAAHASTRARHSAEQIIPENAQPYVGRYDVKIDCADKFADCEKGSANLIITLLPNGIVHRSVVHSGAITFSSSRQYRQDSWFYDENSHQIVVQYAGGVQFFYHIDHAGHMIMDLEKTLTATEINRRYFTNKKAFPDHAYVLKKKSDE